MPSVTPLNAVNKTVNFLPADYLWEMRQVAVKESIAYDMGTAMAVEVSASSPTGKAIAMPTTNASGQNFLGILMENVRTDDADYATAFKLKTVAVPISGLAEAYFTVGSGTFTAADIGRICQFHTDSKSLAVDTNGLGAEISGLISSTKGLCKFSVPKAVTA